MSAPRFRSDIDNIIKEVIGSKVQASEARLRAHRARAEASARRRRIMQDVPKPSKPIKKDPYVTNLERVGGVIIATISDGAEMAANITTRFSNDTNRYSLFLAPIDLSNRLGWYITKQKLKELLGEDI